MRAVDTAAPHLRLSLGEHISKETKGRRGGVIANHIMGHEINPASPNIWPAVSLTLKPFFYYLNKDFINPQLDPKEQV